VDTKRKTGRPPDVGEAREEVVKFRLTSEEKEILQKASEILNYGSVSAYVREAVMDIARVSVHSASAEDRQKVIEDTASAIADRALGEEGKSKVVLKQKEKAKDDKEGD